MYFVDTENIAHAFKELYSAEDMLMELNVVQSEY